MYSENYLYSEEHEWILVEDDVCILGITHFAQDELGEVVFVDLPEVGATFETGDEIGSIESVKAVAEIYTPVSGEIVEVNERLEDSPEQLNEDPHEAGWLCKIRLSAPDETKSLMSAEGYQAFVEEKS